ncbi:NOL6 family protein [Megaselia abdita]
MLRAKKKQEMEQEYSEDSMIENGTSDSDSSEDLNEENSDDGFSDTEDPSPELPKTKRKQEETSKSNKKPKLEPKFKQPTAEEINELRETENNFHSNLFRLQIQEMLKEIKIKPKMSNQIEEWVEKFQDFVMNLKDQKSKHDEEKMTWLENSKVKLPIILECRLKPLKFQFLKPKNKPVIVGSAANNTQLGSKLTVDILVEIPEECFRKDEYLNLVYEKKRALYLTYLTDQLLKTKDEGLKSHLKFSYHHNHPYRPVLEAVPFEEFGKKVSFRVLVVPEESSFKLNRFVPWTSNIRGSTFGEKAEEESTHLATPTYNSNFLFDLTTKSSNTLITEIIGENQNFQEGLLLLKIWLRQRNLDSGYFGFSSHLMAMFIVYLYRKKRLHLSMSSYQVARNVWNHLAVSEWNKEGKGISMCEETDLPNQPTMEQFHSYFNVVFVDHSGYLNLCANLPVEQYLRIRSEAEQAVHLLNAKGVNSFQELFLKKTPKHIQFDHLLRFSQPHVVNRVIINHSKREHNHDSAKHWLPRFYNILLPILRRGLGERVKSIGIVETEMKPWTVNSPALKPEKSLQIGLTLNPDIAFDILDKGPQANEESSKEFRDFWGSKASLRRFQDGSITEACVWSSATDSLSTKRLICQKIVEHLLDHHLQVKSTEIFYSAGQIDKVFKLNTLYVREVTDLTEDAESCTLAVIQNADDLGKQLRQLTDLPLDISGIQGTSSIFRYCNPETILPHSKKIEGVFHGYSVHDIVIQLGASGKWPSTLSALRALKAAFYIQIAEKLRDQFKLQSKTSLDGVYVLKKGYVFRVQIFHPKEIVLLKQTVNEKGITQYKDTPVSLELEKKLSLLPKVTSALHGVYQQYSSFGPTVMIAKRWIKSQLIDNDLWSDECTELMIANQFLKMGALPPTHQPQTGFLRFLDMLANTDWNAEMIVVNFNNEISEKEISKLEQKFAKERDTFPALFITTSYDNGNTSYWTLKEKPSHLILKRLCFLAKSALEMLSKVFEDPKQTIPTDDLFKPNTEGYNALIHLNPSLVQRCLSTEFEEPKKQEGSFVRKPEKPNLPIAGYSPITRALQDLRVRHFFI